MCNCVLGVLGTIFAPSTPKSISMPFLKQKGNVSWRIPTFPRKMMKRHQSGVVSSGSNENAKMCFFAIYFNFAQSRRQSNSSSVFSWFLRHLHFFHTCTTFSASNMTPNHTFRPEWKLIMRLKQKKVAFGERKRKKMQKWRFGLNLEWEKAFELQPGFWWKVFWTWCQTNGWAYILLDGKLATQSRISPFRIDL